MKAKSFLTIIVLLMVSWTASAQGYAIRLTYNTNLRASNSLTSGIVATAPAGSILQVLGQQGRWLQIDRNGNQVWMAGWVGHSRVQSVQPAVSPPQTVSNIDNCCFVDRQCNTDQDWTDGYWAFQNGQCAAPAQTQPQTQATAAAAAAPPTHQLLERPEDIDNCCHLDRECHTEEEWRAGWVAFKELECWDAYHKWRRTPDPNYMPAAGSDNCCTAPGWLCLNDQHFDAGFRAFQDYSHCAPAVRRGYLPDLTQTQPQEPTRSETITAPIAGPITGPIPEDIDNCCFLNWECHSDQDYVSGYERFNHNLCYVPSIEGGIRVEGSGEFRGRIRDALQLLLNTVPRWYLYVTSPSGLHVIKERPGRGASVTARVGVMKVDAFRYALFDLAAIIVHEACHAHRYSDGLESGGYRGERDCTEKEVEVLQVLGPGSPQLQHEIWLLENMHKTKYQWWHDD